MRKDKLIAHAPSLVLSLHVLFTYWSFFLPSSTTTKTLLNRLKTLCHPLPLSVVLYVCCYCRGMGSSAIYVCRGRMGAGNIPAIAPLAVLFLPVILKTVTRWLVDSRPTNHRTGLPFECQLCLTGTLRERNKSHYLQYGKQIERTSQVGLHCATLCHATFNSLQRFHGSVLLCFGPMFLPPLAIFDEWQKSQCVSQH